MIAALLRKELAEWFVGGSTGRYGSWELPILILLTGVVMPIFFSTTKHAADPETMIAFCLAVPLLLEVYAVADAYSGERERGTLEWLFAAPILSSQIVIGKWLAAVVYAMFLGCSSLAVATVVRIVIHGGTASLETYVASLLIATFGAAAMGGIATVVAISASSVRNAVSMFNIGFVLIVMLLSQAPTVVAMLEKFALLRVVTRTVAQFPPVISVGIATLSIAALCLLIATKTVDRKRTA